MYDVFEDYSEILERTLVSSWRGVIGRDHESIFKDVTVTLFGKGKKDGKWEFAYSLKYLGIFRASNVTMDPLNENDENVDIMREARLTANKMLEEVRGEVLG